MYMKIQKVSQIDLIKYISKLDEELNNERTREILYGEYLKNTGKSTRKTKTDKRYVVIAALTRDNFRTNIGDTTVWRVLKVKEKSKGIFDEMLAGDIAIKEAYYKAYPPKQDEDSTATITSASNPSIISATQSDISPELTGSDTGNTQQANNEDDKGAIPDFSSDDDILDTIKGIHQELQQNPSNHLSNKNLRKIDGELFALRQAIVRLMRENEGEE